LFIHYKKEKTTEGTPFLFLFRPVQSVSKSAYLIEDIFNLIFLFWNVPVFAVEKLKKEQ